MSGMDMNEEVIEAVTLENKAGMDQEGNECPNSKQQQDSGSCGSNFILITGLSNDTSANDLKVFLKQFGKFGRIRVMTTTRTSSNDKDAFECRRFAHVAVPSMDGLDQIMETVNRKELKGGFLQVTKVPEDDPLSTEFVNAIVTQPIKDKQSEVGIVIPEKPADKSKKNDHIMETGVIGKNDNEDENRGLLYSDQSSSNSSSPSLSHENPFSILNPQSVCDGEADYAVSSSNQKDEGKSIHQKQRSITFNGKAKDNPKTCNEKDYFSRYQSRSKKHDAVSRCGRRNISLETRFGGSSISLRRRNDENPNDSDGKPGMRRLNRGGRLKRSRSPNPNKRGDLLSYEQIKEAQHERSRKRCDKMRGRNQNYERDSELEFTDDDRHRRHELEASRELKRLEREREKLRREREQIEKDKLELLQFERERQRMERERLEKDKEEVRIAKLKMMAMHAQDQDQARLYHDHQSRKYAAYHSDEKSRFGNTIAELLIEKERQGRRTREPGSGVDSDVGGLTPVISRSSIERKNGTRTVSVRKAWSPAKHALSTNLTRHVEQQQQRQTKHLKPELSLAFNFKHSAASNETFSHVIGKNQPHHHRHAVPSSEYVSSRTQQKRRVNKMLERRNNTEKPTSSRLSHYRPEQWVRGGFGGGGKVVGVSGIGSQTVSMVSQPSSQSSAYNDDASPFSDDATTSVGGGLVFPGGLSAAIASLYETGSSNANNQFTNYYATDYYRY